MITRKQYRYYGDYGIGNHILISITIYS